MKKIGLGQSMSSAGTVGTIRHKKNFEHFKDETNIEKCETLEEVKQEIKRYI